MVKAPDDDELLDLPPPPYVEAPSTSTSSSAFTNPPLPLPASVADALTSPLSTHLQTLPARLRAAQQARSTRQAARDLALVTALVPHVEAFLRGDDLGRRSRPPPLAELVLVPAAAVPRGWELSSATERWREGEIVRVVRVSTGETENEGKERNMLDARPDVSNSSSSSSRSQEFDSWGRWGEDAAAAAASSLALGNDGNGDGDGDSDRYGESPLAWWRDEVLARRLATYLQPKAGPPQLERRQVHAAVERAQEEKKKGWGWGRKKNTSSGGGGDGGRASLSSPSSSSAPQVAAVLRDTKGPSDKDGVYDGGASGLSGNRVSMTVRAEEVTFRKENEFGVWESLAGLGVIVQIRVKRG